MTPEQRLAKELLELYAQMETGLLVNIANKLSMGKEMFIDTVDGTRKVNEWQLERLKQIKGLTDENAEIIAQMSGKTQGYVNEIFDRALITGTKIDEELLKKGIKAGVLNEIDNISESPAVYRALISAKQNMLTTLSDTNRSILANSRQEYVKLVNTVTTKVTSGTQTIGAATKQAVKELANNGIKGFTAKNGTEWSSEAYIKMTTQANIKNMINEVQEIRIKEAGGDYIEINAYSGARPLCSEDQGKVFSLSGNTTPIKDINDNVIYPRAWEDSTYGKPNGILGINCGHQRFMFVPELSAYNRDPIPRKENDIDYEEKQKQRFFERNIRNTKREIAMLKEIGIEDISKERQELLKYKVGLTEHLNATGRTRIQANEWIGTN